jgi:hypothetical protein
MQKGDGLQHCKPFVLLTRLAGSEIPPLVSWQKSHVWRGRFGVAEVQAAPNAVFLAMQAAL